MTTSSRWRRGGVLALILWLLAVAGADAHSGGTPRLTNAPAGPYRLYAWSQPEPWRAGQVHLSLIVTSPVDNPSGAAGSQVEEPITDADVAVILTPLDSPGPAITVQAIPQEQLGTLYYEADTILPAAGRWDIAVQVDGPQGSGDASFQLSALPAQTLNWWLVGGAGGILILIVALMGLWSRTRTPVPVAPRRGKRRVTPQAPGERTH